jgi:hypothetical protein
VIILKWLAKINYLHDNEPNNNSRMINMILIIFAPWLVLEIVCILIDLEASKFSLFIWMAFPVSIRIWWIHGNLKKYL